MKEFTCTISGYALVTQNVTVMAESREEARQKAQDPNVYNNGVWDYAGVDETTVVCDRVIGRFYSHQKDNT